MSLAFASVLDEAPPTRAGVPFVPHWTVSRPGLDRKLDRGADGVLTVVTGPSGSGKSLGVACWAGGSTSPAGLVWVNLAQGAAEPDRVWRLVRSALQRAGEQDLPALPARGATRRERGRDLVSFGERLCDGPPWTLVLDGFPAGATGELGRELATVLDHSGRSLRLIVVTRGTPALDLHRFAAAGDLVRVTPAELRMDRDEIGDVLRLGDARHDRRTVTDVANRTFGWACGVRMAAVALASHPDASGAWTETDRTIADYLAREVLDRVSPPLRRLLVLTSLSDVVAPGVVRASLGDEGRHEVDRLVDETGLVDRLEDGSLVLHPLLRDAARAGLGPDVAAARPADHRAIVQWHAERGSPRTGVELSLAVGDWAGAADVLIETHAVPRLVAGTADAGLLEAVSRAEVRAAEPLLLAAAALGRQDPRAAELALAELTRPSDPAAESPARRLAAAFVRLGVSRLSGSAPAESDLLNRSRELVAEASVAAVDGLADLSASLDAFAGSAEVSAGALERAAVTLARGAEASCTDCAGQLAVVEALRGDLRSAEWHARVVRSAGAAEPRAGLAHAAVALAWVSTERGDVGEARGFLDTARSGPWACEPWLDVVADVVHARLLIAGGRPDEAIRRMAATAARLDDRGEGEWLRELVTAVSGEAFLASGEPQQALAAVTVGLPLTSPERAVLTALACRDIGDQRGAAAAMASVVQELHLAPRATQLQGWVLEARLAHDRGQVDRAVALVDRALRSASAEESRRPLAADAAWLRWFLDRDGSCLRGLRPFATSLLGAVQLTHPASFPGRAFAPSPGEAVLEPLTERETQVLELLAQMCSTEEIAAELYVSANTVKTHLKGIFRKFSVNRRVDAVRRGRELGLC